MAVSEVAVDGVVFPPVAVARPPGSGRSHFLAGAGALRFVTVQSVRFC